MDQQERRQKTSGVDALHRSESAVRRGGRWPTAIDLFSGVGGLSLGLRQARFRVAAALDVSSLATESYRMNFPRVPLIRRDIRTVTGSELLRRARLDEGELDLLAGCPPCQGFSALRTKGQRSAVDDHRNDLLLEFLRLAGEILPRFVLLENVPGLARDDLFRQFTDGLGGTRIWRCRQRARQRRFRDAATSSAPSPRSRIEEPAPAHAGGSGRTNRAGRDRWFRRHCRMFRGSTA